VSFYPFKNIDKWKQDANWERFGNHLWVEIQGMRGGKCKSFWTMVNWEPNAEIEVREKLAIEDSVLEECQPLLDKVHGKLVMVQVRWGNHGPGDLKHFPTPIKTFVDYLDKIDGDYTLYVATDEPEKVLPHFEKYNPLSQFDFAANGNLGKRIFADYFMMTKADLLICSNSSFSWIASLCNEKCQDFIRPNKENELELYNPWESSSCVELDRKFKRNNERDMWECGCR